MSSTTSTTIYREMLGNRLVEIFDEGTTRALYFGGRFLQSRMSLATPHLLTLPYTHYMMFPLLFNLAPESVLIIGIGAGSMVRFFHHHFPGCRIDAVDHSERIINLARGYFQLPEDTTTHIHCCDGLEFLKNSRMKKRYDHILVDAFDEKGMADHIYSRQFFRLCADALNPDGTLSCNIWSGDSQKTSKIATTLSSIFQGKVVLPVPYRGNIINHMRRKSILWEKMLRNKRQLSLMNDHFGIDFSAMISTAIKHNFPLPQQMYWTFRRYTF